ncbi:MLP-like protein 328 [Mercurialis annua]|uniref:MLP-like protein 328 n=1 Tax=Mercurialis annua TaxID=3986 RepID=UPI0021610552|nr:MLP-like protein 328 [Mercurialis annua]
MVQKLETVLKLKSSAEQFYSLWKDRVYEVPTYTPSNVQEVDLCKGDWGISGSILAWYYTMGGEEGVFKEKHIVDDENKIVATIGLEGEVFNMYKVYNPIWEFIPKPNGCSLAKITLEYEKLNRTVPVPYNYMDFLIQITRDSDEGLIRESDCQN